MDKSTCDQMNATEIDNAIERIIPHGAGTVTEPRLRQALTVLAQRIASNTRAYELLGIRTAEELADEWNVSRRRAQAFIATLHERWGVGRKIGNMWCHPPPGPAGPPSTTVWLIRSDDNSSSRRKRVQNKEAPQWFHWGASLFVDNAHTVVLRRTRDFIRFAASSQALRSPLASIWHMLCSPRGTGCVPCGAILCQVDRMDRQVGARRAVAPCQQEDPAPHLRIVVE